ncbi:hypothetical protein BDK51DRAFT_16257, partial [Blyttiomyces helicus]
RLGHTLTVPYAHLAVTDFSHGVPVEQVRKLDPREKAWTFWTSSDAFNPTKPKFLGLTSVPAGEVWVMSNGKVLHPGVHFLIPGVVSIKAVKAADPIAMGILGADIKAKDGSSVDAYAVVYIQITDYLQSANYVDDTKVSDNIDSERAIADVVQETLKREIAQLSVGASGLSAADKAKLHEKVASALRIHEADFGTQTLSVEIRGVFPVSAGVPDKLRAMDPPPPAVDAVGHGLANDYWSEVLTPPFFEKLKFGSEKEVRTPAAVSLEWTIPSPPDFHHFNEVNTETFAYPNFQDPF